MTVEIRDPQLLKLMEQDLRDGRFADVAHLVAVALETFYADSDDDDFDDETAARINEACERASRNEGGYTAEEVLAIVLGNKRSVD